MSSMSMKTLLENPMPIQSLLLLARLICTSTESNVRLKIIFTFWHFLEYGPYKFYLSFTVRQFLWCILQFCGCVKHIISFWLQSFCSKSGSLLTKSIPTSPTDRSNNCALTFLEVKISESQSLRIFHLKPDRNKIKIISELKTTKPENLSKKITPLENTFIRHIIEQASHFSWITTASGFCLSASVTWNFRKIFNIIF